MFRGIMTKALRMDCALTASAIGCLPSGQESSVALSKLGGHPATTQAATGVRQGTEWTKSTEPPSGAEVLRANIVDRASLLLSATTF